MNRIVTRLLHKVRKNLCDFSVVLVDKNSSERQLVCSKCGRIERSFNVY